jgi:hypothetical protein
MYEANLLALESKLVAIKKKAAIRDDGKHFVVLQGNRKFSIQWDDTFIKAQRVFSFMKKKPKKVPMDGFFWDQVFIKQFWVEGDRDEDDGYEVDDEKKPSSKDYDRDDDDDEFDENQTLNELRKESVAKKAAKPTVVAKKKKKAKVVVMKSEVKGAFQHAKGADGKTRIFFNPYAPKK